MRIQVGAARWNRCFYSCIGTALLSLDLSAQSWHQRFAAPLHLQRSDFSYGAASAITLLTAIGWQGLNEEFIIKSYLNSLPEERALEKVQQGFSMLDLRNLLRNYGVQSTVVKGAVDQLANANGIGIVHLKGDPIEHFAVIRFISTQSDSVLLLDPARGNMRLTKKEFADIWTGYALLINDPGAHNLQSYMVAKVPNHALVARAHLSKIANHDRN
jgi:predicted double-glycine peptidase